MSALLWTLGAPLLLPWRPYFGRQHSLGFLPCCGACGCSAAPLLWAPPALRRSLGALTLGAPLLGRRPYFGRSSSLCLTRLAPLLWAPLFSSDTAPLLWAPSSSSSSFFCLEGFVDSSCRLFLAVVGRAGTQYSLYLWLSAQPLHFPPSPLDHLDYLLQAVHIC